MPILEAYQSPLSVTTTTTPRSPETPAVASTQTRRLAMSLVPFVWSANSETSLEATPSSHARYNRDPPSLDLDATQADSRN
ncbi:hypothetical protein MCOR25_001211 [Pyricularia grisea]|nr:hypothetical protein MCOR25_001211 [Pyricularia grisea]